MPYNINKISAIIFNRRSSKNYLSHKLIPQEDLLSFFEAARWAPSASNRQPWRYIVFSEENPEAIASMRACLTEANQYWASSAPVLILCCALLEDENGREIRTALHDLGLANENLLLQIRSLGYNCRPMGGFDKELAKQLFNLPEHFQPVLTIAAGYPGKMNTLPVDIQESEKEPRTRNPISTWVHIDHWGNPFLNS